MKDRAGQLWRLAGLVELDEGPTVLVLSSDPDLLMHRVLVLDAAGYRWPQGSVRTLGEWNEERQEGSFRTAWERLA